MPTDADLMQAIQDRLADISEKLDGGIPHPLTEEETQWVRLAIQREAQSIKLRQAVIEKTLAGLVWLLIVALGAIVFEYLKGHGWKP